MKQSEGIQYDKIWGHRDKLVTEELIKAAQEKDEFVLTAIRVRKKKQMNLLRSCVPLHRHMLNETRNLPELFFFLSQSILRQRLVYKQKIWRRYVWKNMMLQLLAEA
jgi:hypothetical protein